MGNDVLWLRSLALADAIVEILLESHHEDQCGEVCTLLIIGDKTKNKTWRVATFTVYP